MPLTLRNFNKKADYLCFTANTANTSFYIERNGSPTSVSLETSTDWTNWSSYTIWNSITLNNIWDKVYFRNTSTTDTGFSTSTSNYYSFAITSWTLSANWDITTLLNKNWTKTVSDYCFYMFFYWCERLTSSPKLPATTLANYCYNLMFYWCTNLITAPELPATILANNCYGYMFYWCTTLTVPPQLVATTLANYCYAWMFRDCTNLTTLPKIIAITLNNYCCQLMFLWCSKIKISETQTWEYQTPYRMPDTWTWTLWTAALDRVFMNTWWTFTWTPDINTTYYTSNTVV